MRRAIGIALLTSAMVVLGAASASFAQDAPSYLPQEGDEVVIYTHKFNAEHFAEATDIVVDEFTGAQAELGQTRRNYFLVNPTTYEVVAVSFFEGDESVDEWHGFMGRLETLDKLEPLRSAPMTLERYQVYRVTDTE